MGRRKPGAKPRRAVRTDEIRLAEALFREGLSYAEMARHPGFAGSTPARIRGIVQNHLSALRQELSRAGGLSPLSPSQREWINRNLPRWLEAGMTGTEIHRRVQITTGVRLTKQSVYYWIANHKEGRIPCRISRSSSQPKS